MNEELWRVQLSTGEIRTMTLDALDDAFNEGVIDARVPVLAPGSHSWTTLAEAAGLEEAPVVEQTPSLSPIAMGPDSMSSMQTLPAAVDTSLDLDLPEDFEVGRRSRGLLIGVIPGLLAVAAALVVVVTRLGEAPPPEVKVTNAVQAPPPAAEVLPPAAQAEPTPTPTTEAVPAKPQLSEWQKQLLEANDKAREEKARAKAQEKVVAPRPKAGTKANPGLLNGGDKFDPLNGAL